MTHQAYQAAQIITLRCPTIKPKLAIMLGSGLGELVNEVENATIIPYSHLPGFHQPSIEGHSGHVHVGILDGIPVMYFQGRAHLYEGVNPTTILTMVRTAKLLGCESYLATNAAGSLHADVTPGNLVLIRDHINFQFNNVCVGPNDDRFGPRFFGMEEAYDPELRALIKATAAKLNILLHEGVYVGTLGPAFETPAEINAFRILGADVVGMSTIPEVIAARHCGLRMAVISVVTNLAAGMNKEALSHETTLRGAQLGTEKLMRLVNQFIRNLAAA